jgi:gliding motility-associated-like protein
MKKLIPPIFLVSILAIAPVCVSGQGLCAIGGGDFALEPSEGCAPLTVKIVNKLNNGSSFSYADSYDNNTENPTLTRNAEQFTYHYPGTYTILQSANVGGKEVYHCKEVRVFENRPVNVSYSSCGAGKVKLHFSNDIIIQAYDRVEVNWGDGHTEVLEKGDALEMEHEFSNLTIMPVVKIKGLHNANKSCTMGTEMTFFITFQQPQLKNIQVTSVEMKGNGNLEVLYEGLTSITTDIMSSSDGGINYQVGGTRASGGAQFYRIANLNTAQVYKVKLASKDLCGEKLESEVVSSMVLKGASADEKNIISWNEYPIGIDFQEYRLMKDGVILKTFTDIKTTSFEDDDVQCGDHYEYAIIATTKTITSTSAPISISTSLSSPKPITEVIVTVNANDHVQLNANVPGAGSKTNYSIVIERGMDEKSNYKKINTLYNEIVFDDFNVKSNDHAYCYRMIYENACGQKSPPSEPVCSILLKNESPLLTWTAEKPFIDNITSYTMIQKGSAGSDSEKDMALRKIFHPDLAKQSDKEYTFQVRADSENGKFQSFSNLIHYKRDADVFAPDAFSPNDDGYNDTFEVKADMYKAFKMSVLNRWGEVLFYSDDILKGWDGKIKQKPAPVGTYIWHVEIVDNLDQTVKKSGSFVLLK